jgi:3-methylcrotonyl-CoA carboxylase alpha subunit
MFTNLLIANRGEIACRIIATARRMGLRTIAVYSDADAASLHVALADEAWRIGPPPPRESYLDSDAIVRVVRRTGAQAVHPGYGFLSENAAFAEACAAAGTVFVGPPAAAIRAMGDKARAKALMAQAGVPLVPGYHGAAQDAATLQAEARRIGYPVLIKASAGGGGKGMRVVRDDDAFTAALAAAQREAHSAFGDDRVLLERYLTEPRHIEMQVFGDRHGDVLHLFERDCSIQRRHQKVIEEAPAPGMTAALRDAMGEAAVDAARAVWYVGAGTVEFCAAGGEFFFMEMNTRLQVEHPVTEMILDIDLVEWQLRIAAGEPLPLRQEDVRARGHAIEARLYAEDPARDFLPSVGTLTQLRLPAPDKGVRVDAGVRAGDRITPDYDPMIAKLVVHGTDRAEAVRRLGAALACCEVAGVATNLHLLAAIAAHPAFGAGGVDTGFIAAHEPALLHAPSPPDFVIAAAAAAVLRARTATDASDPWNADDSWRLNGEGWQNVTLRGADGDIAIRARRAGASATLAWDGAVHDVAWCDGVLRCDGVARHVTALYDDAHITVLAEAAAHGFALIDPLAPPQAAAAGSGRVLAPIPGRIAAMLVAEGAQVVRGQALVVLEAMKMELTLTAGAAGTVASVRGAVGERVDEGDELVVITPDGAG